jgi:ornithine cyclodeaminase/alanine dehydrogenase-like protein (mu-crystallin family)
MLHLTDEIIAQLLDLDSVQDVVWRAFADLGRGEAATTQRVRAMAPSGMASAMAAVVPPYSGGKVYATKNGQFTFVNVLFDLDGKFLCTLDGDVLTRFRTPAGCSLAIREMAPQRVESAALVGAGKQGWFHLEMLWHQLPQLSEVRIADARREAADDIVARARKIGIPAVAVDTPTDAVRNADVVLTITPSNTPLFAADAISDNTLVCGVGATKYDRCELPTELVSRCVAVVCDDAIGSRVECGDLIHAVKAGHFAWEKAIELADVAAGKVKVPRAGNGPVLFETQGVALQDVAAAGLAWERYQQKKSEGKI